MTDRALELDTQTVLPGDALANLRDMEAESVDCVVKEARMADWRVICGDCLEILPTLEAESVDLVVADPPYNIGFGYDLYRDNLPQEEYRAKMLAVIEAAADALKPGGSLWWLQYPEEAAWVWEATQAEVPLLCPVRLVSWCYHGHSTGTPLRRGFRLWCWFSRGEPSLQAIGFPGEYRNPDDQRVARMIAGGSCPSDYDWWEQEQVKNVSAEKTEHPCQIPVAMLRRIVQACSHPGGLVLDPFCGSGSTGEAAIGLGRRFVGIERDPGYCEMARRRIGGANVPLEM